MLVLALGSSLAACARPTPTPDPAATSAAPQRATESFAHGALLQTPTPTTGPEVAATGRALPRDPTADEMGDGEHHAFVTGPGPGSTAALAMNPVVMFGGDEADAASIADGHTTERHALPNDYYIRDLDPATVALPVSPTAAIEIIGFTADGSIDDEPVRIDLGAFLGWFAGTPVADSYFFRMNAKDLAEVDPLMIVTTRDGVVVRLQEQYLP